MATNDQKKIFIYGSSAGLGDAIMLLPGLLELCKIAQVEITISLTRRTRHLSEVFEFYLGTMPNSVAYEVISVEDGLVGRIRHLFKLRGQKFDSAYFPTSGANLKSMLSLLIINPKLLADSIKSLLLKPQRSEHKTSHFSRKLGLKASKINYREIQHELKKKSGILTSQIELGAMQGFVVIAPGSGVLELHKRWPVSSFVDLIVNLKESKNLDSLLLGGADQSELLNDILQKCKVRGVNCTLAHPKSILESIGILNSAECMVSGCSSAIHMGSLTGVRIIGLYGPTDFIYTGPWNYNFDIRSLNLDCGPCYLKTPSGCAQPICMNGITVDTVLEAVSFSYLR